MQCPIHNAEHAEILLDYCAGKLSPESLAAFESHLAGLPGMQGILLCGRQAAWTALDVWEAEPVSEKFDSSAVCPH